MYLDRGLQIVFCFKIYTAKLYLSFLFTLSKTFLSFSLAIGRQYILPYMDRDGYGKTLPLPPFAMLAFVSRYAII